MVEPPKLASGENVPQYVEELIRKSEEKLENRKFTIANLIVSTVAATASVLAVIIGFLQLCL